MTRYQVHLDTPQLEILDYFASQDDVPRSRALRSLIDKAGKNITKKNINKPKNTLLEMCGAAGNVASPANLARDVDKIYQSI
ncbi:MAG: hypothetical protein AAB768_03700 [Patescibacteria group bacterium]